MNSLPGLRAIHALRQCGLPEDASYVQLAETITLFEAALELDASLPPNQCAIPGASRACLEAELVKIKSLFCLSASAAGDVAASVAGAKAAAAVATATAATAAVGGKGGRSKAGTIKPGAASGSARISKLQQSWAGFWCAGDLVFASFSK
jgi:hypothetical protein